jgi:hypothetical protein
VIVVVVFAVDIVGSVWHKVIKIYKQIGQLFTENWVLVELLGIRVVGSIFRIGSHEFVQISTPSSSL